MTSTDWRNKLYFGDNLDILRESVADETDATSSSTGRWAWWTPARPTEDDVAPTLV